MSADNEIYTQLDRITDHLATMTKQERYTAACPVTMSRTACQGLSRIKSYYVEGGFSHLIHMTAAHLW